jgi:hypothetical protein
MKVDPAHRFRRSLDGLEYRADSKHTSSGIPSWQTKPYAPIGCKLVICTQCPADEPAAQSRREMKAATRAVAGLSASGRAGQRLRSRQRVVIGRGRRPPSCMSNALVATQFPSLRGARSAETRGQLGVRKTLRLSRYAGQRRRCFTVSCGRNRVEKGWQIADLVC